MPTRQWLEANRDKQRANQRAWYAKNRTKAKKWVQDRRLKIVVWFNEYKSSCSCACGENDPICLDFHHKNVNNKVLEISNAVSNGWSLQKLQAEIAKCKVVCANCHRKIHRKSPHSSMD